MEKERLLEWLKITASKADVLQVLTAARIRFHALSVCTLEEEAYWRGFVSPSTTDLDLDRPK